MGTQPSQKFNRSLIAPCGSTRCRAQAGIMRLAPGNDMLDIGFGELPERFAGVRRIDAPKTIGNSRFDGLRVAVFVRVVGCASFFWSDNEAPPLLGRTRRKIATMRNQGEKNCKDPRERTTMVIQTGSHSQTWPSPSRSFMYW